MRVRSMVQGGRFAPPCSRDDQLMPRKNGRKRSVARALFYDSPAAALGLLDAGHEPAPRSTAGQERAWLTGAALGALGRFGAAEAVLRPLAGADGGPYASLACSTLASHQRQLGRHAEALAYDQRAEMTIPAARDRLSESARFDAELGLTADAVGLGRVDEAVERLARIDRRAPTNLATDPVLAGWRRRVRHGWVATEIALLRGDSAAAVVLAEDALAEAVAAGAPRHVAKCALFLGASGYVRYRDASVAHGVQNGVVDDRKALDGREETLVGARTALTQAAAAAAALGALPLRWVAESLLAEVLALAGEPEAMIGGHQKAAATVVTAIGAELPAEQRSGWLSRPDLVALRAVAPR
jgi:hypothetical protein